ncbi:hypothetical protein T4C_7963 [Trichinella pseudospiralis]|uniref:Uncharacterized protein n=1 Tax=Trichinella pseudospiralis TaxID=6337 RepID=A0A0V1JM55_TRIPS|nr:hypothetical protein T4C_7963 [Trichinella pseudospiralis]
MLIHYEYASFFKISREVCNQEKSEYFHCISETVPNRLISIMSIIVKKAFSRKFQNFLNYRLACFAKNGEKVVFRIWSFFDCNIFILLNYIILHSFSENCQVVGEINGR